MKGIYKLKDKVLDFLGRNFNPNFIYNKSSIELEIVNICNANCIFCPWITIKNTNKKFNIMTDKTYEEVLKKIRKQKYRNISFTPTTGEILLNKNWDKFIEKAAILPNIERILFYSNRILMDDENQNKLVTLTKKYKKIKDIHFSIGGIDNETYHLMYGVDRFEVVQKNINSLLKKLKNEKSEVEVVIEIRIPKKENITEKQIKNIFNSCNYEKLKINIMKKFARIKCIQEREELEYNKVKLTGKKPCVYLYKTRYDANGGIWADGCVVSELPNNTSLFLGTINDELELIEKRRKKIIAEWKEGRKPLVCEKCSFYTKYYK